MKTATHDMLDRSNELHERLLALLADAEFDTSPREAAALGLCLLAQEHATAMRALLAIDLPTSAVSLMRLQFEAVTRSLWVLFAASDAQVEKLTAPLTLESERAAKNLPSLATMIDEIGQRCGPSQAATAAHAMLLQFRQVCSRALNSFVHGGLHALRRCTDGFPSPLILDVLRNSNGLLTMTGMTMAILSGNAAIARAISRIQPEFADCLPQLLAPRETDRGARV